MEQIVYRERKNTACEKWDGMRARFGQDDLLPLWIADMDFEAPGCVRRCLEEYVEQGTFGYYAGQDAWADAFLSWQQTRHGVRPEREWLRFSPGVVTAVNWMIRLMTREGDGVLVLTPVYYPFFRGIQQNGRNLVTCDLRNENGRYTIDFDALEAAAAREDVRLLILCSPHNPAGRVWTREELWKVTDCCFRHDVRILSDEIHQDLTFFGHRQVPILSVVDQADRNRVAAATSATKTFNLAALQNSILMIPDSELRERFDAMTAAQDLKEGNAVGYLACESAYRGGAAWLDALRGVIEENYRCLEAKLKTVPGAVLSPLEGTYLAWLDLGRCLNGQTAQHLVQDRCALAVDYGSWFGGERFASFIRINLATRKENILTAADALCRNLQSGE